LASLITEVHHTNGLKWPTSLKDWPPVTLTDMQKMSLQALAREQQELAATATSGRSARTVWGGHEHVLRQTLIALTANSSMSEHENPGEATIQVITGRVRLDANGDQWEGRQGDLLFMPPDRHSLVALEDAVVLLTVAKIGRG
jgi:quercetin dioxygenase-like cupin family protein